MKVLIFVHSPTWFTELSLLGQFIHRAPGHEVLFYVVDFGHWTMHEIARSLAQDGIVCILECERSLPKAASEAIRLPVAEPLSTFADTQRARAVRSWLCRHDPKSAADFRAAVTELTGAIGNARELIWANRPDVIVLGGNNPGYTTAGLIEGAHREGVPAVLVPSTMSNGLEEAEVYAGDPRYYVTSAPAKVMSSLFPQWAIRHNGLDLLRCPPARALAMEALNIAPPQPWAFNSGFADAIAAESNAMIDYAAAAGLPRESMTLTGSPSDDAMAAIRKDAARLRHELYAELGLPAGRPMLLTALPPDFLYVTGRRPQCDFQQYDVLVKFWIDTLANQDAFNVVVALHPSVKVQSMRHIESTNVRIASRRTADLIPLADLYVACVSSTIRWAIASGKPVINYDVYRYRYTDFVGVGGVAATEEQSEFRALVQRLTGDPGALAELRQSEGAEAPRWGLLDGRCSERILTLLAKTVAEVRPRRALRQATTDPVLTRAIHP